MNPATAEQVEGVASDGLIQVELLLNLSAYAEMGKDLAAIRRRLDIPASASNTQVIREAVHRLAHAG
jgi:hypothetical protein